MARKFKFPVAVLVSESDFITNAFTANTVPMTIRLNAPFNAETIALTALIVQQGTKQKSDGADIGDLSLAQSVALTAMNAHIKSARNTAKRAFKGQTVKLHEEFQVGEAADELEAVMERAGIISASL